MRARVKARKTTSLEAIILYLGWVLVELGGMFPVLSATANFKLGVQRSVFNQDT